MTARQLIIVQPWFTARGHPAQSLLNTARVLGYRHDVSYLVSWDPNRPELLPILQQLREYGEVRQFHVNHTSLARGTMVALWDALQVARVLHEQVSIFFLDGHIPTLGALWPVTRMLSRNLASVSMLGLAGPEVYAQRRFVRYLVTRFLAAKNARLFLRTEELVLAWQETFEIRDRDRLDTLPSLEIPETDTPISAAEPTGPMKFGVLGQVRSGKGLEWLVPLFQAHPQIGDLHIGGTFYNNAQRERLNFLQTYPLFKEEFIPDHELVARARTFDYLLILYDDWDCRLEAATLYLAARADRPVISYNQGWCGRMVNQYRCGLSVPPNSRPAAEFFRHLPQRGSEEYQRLVSGMKEFHSAHSGEARRSEFLNKLFHKDASPCASRDAMLRIDNKQPS